jgi:hypothetical protein
MARWTLPLLLFCAACSSPERRAVDFLAREAPRWRVENGCFSCHNNGDASRALLAAGRTLDPATLDFLRRPARWTDNGPDEEFSDRRLAALQFAFALSELGDVDALRRAAPLVRELVGPDGAVALEDGGLPGSPITYGRTLSTAVARRVLAKAGEPVEGLDAWLRARRPSGPLDAAALLLADARPDCVELLRETQTSDGGWGPTRTSPPEVFDTALALLALPASEVDMLRRGRAFLLAAQFPDGSWPETTRPPGSESYAQRISTSAWATMALLRVNAEATLQR